MKKEILLIFGLMALVCISSCSTIKYNIVLLNVDNSIIKDKSPVIKEIIEKVERIDRNDKKHIDIITKYEYKDENVEIVFSPTNYDIGFDILNKTNDSIRVIWDDAAFVDIDGNSHKIMHLGVVYIDRNKSWPPGIIVKQQRLVDLVAPTNCIKWNIGGKTWESLPFLPTSDPDSTKKLEDVAKPFVGKKFQLLLPLQINNIVSNYLFTFEVKNFEVGSH